MSTYLSSNLSKSQPNLYSTNSKNSLEKKAWFIGKFLCRNLDRLTYLKVIQKVCELKTLKTRVKLNHRGWSVGKSMDWSSPVSQEKIALSAIHNISQDLEYPIVLFVVLKFDNINNVRMYEILAYKFDNAGTALHFQEIFKNLTGIVTPLQWNMPTNDFNTLTPLAPGLHNRSWTHVDKRALSPVNSFYKYQGHTKKDSVSDLDSFDNGLNVTHSLVRPDHIEAHDSVWNHGETKVYANPSKVYASNRSVLDERDAYHLQQSFSRGLDYVDRRSLDQLATDPRGIHGSQSIYTDNRSYYKNIHNGENGSRAPSVYGSAYGGSNDHYFSQQQNRFLQVPRIGKRSESDTMSIISQTGSYLLNPKFKRNYVLRGDNNNNNNNNDKIVIQGEYPQQETRFL